VALSSYVNFPFAQLLIISPLAFLVLGGIALRRNLLIAISSNLTLICVGFLLFSWHPGGFACYRPRAHRKRPVPLCTLAAGVRRIVCDVPFFLCSPPAWFHEYCDARRSKIALIVVCCDVLRSCARRRWEIC